MINPERKNPIVRLLALLPKEVAEKKRKALEVDLMAIGKYEHYRQSVRRENWQMADTHVGCAVLLIRHLGLSLAFFSATDQERDREIGGLVRQYYHEAIDS